MKQGKREKRRKRWKERKMREGMKWRDRRYDRNNNA